jgi:hypothetical protein
MRYSLLVSLKQDRVSPFGSQTQQLRRSQA